MLKNLLIIGGILIALALLAFIGLRSYTKSFSPQAEATLKDNDLLITINYSRPYKNDREIFGELVPYGEVWRTGANEATTFSTTRDLLVKGQLLPAGDYTLWTMPGEEVWQVIWNNETGQWGVDPFRDGIANRRKENDALIVSCASITSSKMFEQFTIELDRMGEDIHMTLMWDHTMIVVPMALAN